MPFPALLLAPALVLSPALESWKEDIEARGGGKVFVLRLTPGVIPDDAPHPEMLRQIFASPGFLGQFQASHAMSVTNKIAEGTLRFVLLNTLTEAEWKDDTDAVLSHEFGHLWLKALGYPTPIYTQGDAACLALHTGDIVQHILIRREMERRGVGWRRFWIGNLEKALNHLESTEPAATVPRCQRLAQLSLWVDVRLGLSAEDWPSREAFLTAMARSFAGVGEAGEEIAGYLTGLAVDEKATHRAALQRVFARLKEYVLQFPPD